MPDFIEQMVYILGLMIIYNIISNRLLAQRYQLLVAFVLSGLIIIWGIEVLGLGAADLGLGNPLKGLVVGGLFSMFLAYGLSLASNYKRTRNLFKDTRVINVPLSKLLKKTLIDIPITTVLFEEVLFRGLVLGYLLTILPTWEAILWSSALFGLWHILPAINFAESNDKASRFPLPTVLGTVIFTALTGIVFAWLRVESGSILAPMMVHFAANSGSFIASWFHFSDRHKSSKESSS